MSLVIKDVSWNKQQVTSLDFDGINDYVNCGTTTILGNQSTMMCWAKFSTTGDAGKLVSNRSFGTPYYFIGINGGKIYGGVGTSTTITQTSDYEANTWYHIVLVQDHANSLLKLYVNGSLVKSDTSESYSTDGRILSIGAQTTDSGSSYESFVKSQICEVMCFGKSLDLTDIQSIYNLNRKRNTIVTDGLVAYYRMENGSGSTLIDTVGSNDGTNYGATWKTDASDGTGVNIDSTNIVNGYPNGSAISLNGTNEYIDLTPKLSSFSNLSKGSIVGLFKINSAVVNGYAILAASDSGDASSEVVFWINSVNHFSILARDNSGVMFSAETSAANGPKVGEWYCAIITSDGINKPIIYVNGDDKTDASAGSGFFSDVSGLDSMSIGRNVDSGGGQWYMNGDIAKVMILDESLTAIQVKDLTNKILGGRR